SRSTSCQPVRAAIARPTSDFPAPIGPIRMMLVTAVAAEVMGSIVGPRRQCGPARLHVFHKPLARVEASGRMTQSRSTGELAMSVAKVIELNAASNKSMEDAVQRGLKKAAESVKNIKGAWVNEIKVVTDDAGTITEWRVNMKVNFIVQ